MPLQQTSRELSDRGTLRLLDSVAPAPAPAVTDATAVRVLIADGHALVRAGLRALLCADRRIRVIAEAGSGEEAFELARWTRPDVVVVDAGLPGRQSVDLTAAGSAGSAPAVVLLTSDEDDESLVAALRAGVRGVLLKDAAPAELLRAVELVARGDALLSPRVTRRLIAKLKPILEPPSPTLELVDALTPREREVVRLVALGLSNAEIAEELVVSPATVKTHVARAMFKVRAHHRASLVAFAYEVGLARA
jgi:DNA-binding NarL/FixJ family response regulator